MRINVAAIRHTSGRKSASERRAVSLRARCSRQRFQFGAAVRPEIALHRGRRIGRNPFHLIDHLGGDPVGQDDSFGLRHRLKFIEQRRELRPVVRVAKHAAVRLVGIGSRRGHGRDERKLVPDSPGNIRNQPGADFRAGKNPLQFFKSFVQPCARNRTGNGNRWYVRRYGPARR